MGRFVGLLGLLTMMGLAYLFSTDRRAIKFKTVAWGLGLQLTFAFFVLHFEFGRRIFAYAGGVVNNLLNYSYYGSRFLFGDLGLPSHQIPNFPASPEGFIFAFQVLTTIIFIAAFFALLYHIGVMQILIKAFAWVMTRVMGASGAEIPGHCGQYFHGAKEAPLTIRPFLSKLTKSELMCVMTCGMAHVSGGMLAAYVSFGIEAKHLLTAVIMTAPGTLLMAKMLVPETEIPLTAGHVQMPPMEKEPNIFGAISRGTVDGLHLALNVGAMLVSFIALLYLANGILGGIHNFLALHGVAWFPSSLNQIFGWVFAPIAWLVGVQWHDAPAVGNLLGTRMASNELVAFTQLAAIKDTISARSFTIATFACADLLTSAPLGFRSAELERWPRNNVRCWRNLDFAP